MSDGQSSVNADHGYDVIGDVHGNASKLIELLEIMDYSEADGAWRHPTRQAVFVGDLIDRGPEQFESVRIARAMVEDGDAFIVAGNHEFNAVAFHTPDPNSPDGYLRPHSDKNCEQHREFLEQVPTESRAEILEWFKTLPLWLEFDGVRVVHACWDRKSIDYLAARFSNPTSLTTDLVVSASEKDSREWRAVETLLKGPEIAIDQPYRDKDGNERGEARFCWWLPEVDRLSDAAMIPGHSEDLNGNPYPGLPDTPIEPPVEPYRDPIPVIYGHYWRTGTPEVTSDRTACVDYSAGNGGPLVAYRWTGESKLSDENFVSTS